MAISNGNIQSSNRFEDREIIRRITRAGASLLAIGLVTCASTMAATAMAQDTGAAAYEPAEDQAFTEIVVTAQGRKQNLQDVPVSATVTSGEALMSASISNLEALSARLPNFKIATAPVSDFVTIRGVGSSLNLGFEQSVGTFVDGIYRGRSRTTRAALFDVERVEVLKGPQTTFFGNNTIAGALNIASRKPGKDFEANAVASYVFETNAYLLEAGVSVPLTDRLAVRIAGRQSGQDGYIDNDYLGEKGPDLNEKVGRLSLAWDPADFVEVEARIDAGRSRNTSLFHGELLQCPAPAAFGGANGLCAAFLGASGGSVDDKLDYHSTSNPSFLDYDFVEAASTIRFHAGDYTLSLITGYFHHDYALLTDPTPIPADFGGSVVGTDYTTAIRVDEKYEQFSQELRFASPEDRLISFQTGLYYQHGKLDIDFFQAVQFAPLFALTGGVVAPGTPISARVQASERSDSFSGFGAATINATPDLRINLSGRYVLVDKHDSRSATAGAFTGVPSASNFTLVPASVQDLLITRSGVDTGGFSDPYRSNSRFLPSAGVQYDVAPGVMTYATYSRGFKAGGFSLGSSNSSFGPETVNAFEAGVKSYLFDRKMTLNIAAFHSRYKGLQETSTILLPGGAVTRQIVDNVGTSVAKGVEVNSTFRVTPELTFAADVAYLSSKYTDYPNGPCTTLQAATTAGACVQDLSGRPRAFAPEFSGNVSATYRRDVSGGLTLTINPTVYFTSRFYQQPTADPRLAQPGYAKVDARIALGSSDGRWTVALIGKNLTDKITASYRQIVVGAPGSIDALPDPPRTFGLQFSFNY